MKYYSASYLSIHKCQKGGGEGKEEEEKHAVKILAVYYPKGGGGGGGGRSISKRVNEVVRSSIDFPEVVPAFP